MNLNDIVDPPVRKSTGSRKADLERTLVTIGSSLVAVLVALIISGLLLAVTGKDPFAALAKLGDVATNTDKLYEAVSRSMPFIMSAVAFAVTATIGRFLSRGTFRISRIVSMPSISGIMMSMSTISTSGS